MTLYDAVREETNLRILRFPYLFDKIKPFLVILERFMRFQDVIVDVNVADLIASAIVTGERSQKRERQGFHFST